MEFFNGLENVTVADWWHCADLAVSTDAVAPSDLPSKGRTFEVIVQNTGSHDVRVRCDGADATADEGYVLFAGVTKSFSVKAANLSFCSADGSDSTVVVTISGVNLEA